MVWRYLPQKEGSRPFFISTWKPPLATPGKRQRTYLLHLFCCVVSSTHLDYAQGCWDVQWGEEDILICFYFDQVFEEVQAELGIGCTECAHCDKAKACNSTAMELISQQSPKPPCWKWGASPRHLNHPRASRSRFQTTLRTSEQNANHPLTPTSTSGQISLLGVTWPTLVCSIPTHMPLIYLLKAEHSGHMAV